MRLNHQKLTPQPPIPTPTSLLTLDQLPLFVSTGKVPAAREEKTTIPIKQYSNKFLRETSYRHSTSCIHSHHRETSKVHQQWRFNTLMRKKQMLSKQTPKHFVQNPGWWNQKMDGSMASVGPLRETKGLLRTRAATEVVEQRPRLHQDKEASTESSIIELENELVIPEHLINLLSSSPDHFYQPQAETTEARGFRRVDCSFRDRDEKAKISQSRGL